MIWHWQFTLRSWIGPFTIYLEPLIVKRIFLGAAPVTPGTCELSRGDLKFKISTSFNQKIELPAYVVVSIKLNFSSLPYSCHTVNKYSAPLSAKFQTQTNPFWSHKFLLPSFRENDLKSSLDEYTLRVYFWNFTVLCIESLTMKLGSCVAHSNYHATLTVVTCQLWRNMTCNYIIIFKRHFGFSRLVSFASENHPNWLKSTENQKRMSKKGC